MRADGSESTVLVCGAPFPPYPTGRPDYLPGSPEWSPDGKKIIFDDFYNGLVTMNPDGASLRTIYGGRAEHPSWHPVVR